MIPGCDAVNCWPCVAEAGASHSGLPPQRRSAFILELSVDDEVVVDGEFCVRHDHLRGDVVLLDVSTHGRDRSS